MRALFLLLVLANLAFFAWSRYFSPADASADPLPLGRQIQPEQLRILAPSEVPPPVAAAKPAAAPAPASPVAATAAAPGSCIEWGSFTLADVPRAEKALEPLALGERLAQRRTEELAGWWVFVPPQANRQGALKKAAELKSRGVDDYFVVVDDSPYRWSVSLGVFRNEDAAQSRLAALRAKGVKSAKLGPRETLVPKVWLQVRGADSTLEARLREIARQVEGTDLKSCSPEKT
jgi:sporulation related protein